MTTPAQSLLGLTLQDGWKVTQALPSPQYQGGTGGFFSAGYIVEKNNQKAFLKALDYSDALRSPDPATTLQSLTSAYNFERQLLYQCRDKNLSRVIQALGDGKIDVDPQSPIGAVQYLIFELADTDVRRYLNLNTNLDFAWKLRTLHHICTGLRQLHNIEVAHQDLKPSNVVLVKDQGGKLSDLGCAAAKTLSSPRENCEVAGDLTYAPPELLYHYLPPDWGARRFGCDLYLLGSMMAFLFSKVSMTHLLFSKCDPSFLPGRWTDSYSAVLPFLRDALDMAACDITKSYPPNAADALDAALRQLCDPDPMLRGHPVSRAHLGDSYSLERYVSLFDLLSRRAEIVVRQPLP